MLAAEGVVAVAEATVSIRLADFAQAEASLSDTIATPRSVDLASYEAEVSRARAVLAATEARLSKAEIRSPIAGRVTDIVNEIGEQVIAASTVLTVQTTDEQFRISADVSEADIAKIEIDDPVVITFDAFGSDSEFMGVVQKIDPAEKIIEGVVYYKIEVYLNESVQLFILKPGMSTDLVINTAELENTLTIPQRAVLKRGDLKIVRLLKGKDIEEVEVITGLRGDQGRVEVISGLSEGDEVIISIKTP